MPGSDQALCSANSRGSNVAGWLRCEQSETSGTIRRTAAAPLFSELCSIVQKTMGLADPLRDALRPFESQIDAAFVYGSVAKGRDTAGSDVDVMLISDDLTYGDVFPALEDVGARLGRTVNPTILSRKDLSKRVKADSAFVTRTLSQAKVWLIGGKDALSAGESLRGE